jgi:flagellar motor switch protein FliG
MAVTDSKFLAGPDKAAVMMLALGDEHTKDLWTRLDEEEIKEISQAMSNLGSISSDVMESLFVEFASRISSTGNIVGSYEATERLLMKALKGDRVESIMEEIRGPAGRTMWDKLANVNEQVLANYLKNEYPQTVAVVMSKINSAHAAKVLATLPEDFSLEVVNRMLQMESVQ